MNTNLLKCISLFHASQMEKSTSGLAAEKGLLELYPSSECKQCLFEAAEYNFDNNYTDRLDKISVLAAKYYIKNALNIVLVNGKICEELSELNFNNKIEINTKDIKSLGFENEKYSFNNLFNLATAVDFNEINITDSTTLNLIYISTSSYSQRNVFNIHGDCSITEIFISTEEQQYESLVSCSSIMNIKDNSTLNLTRLQQLATQTTNIDYLQANLRNSSLLNLFYFTKAENISDNETEIKFIGEGSKAKTYSSNIAKDSSHTSSNSIVEHLAPNCESFQLYKGITEDNANSRFEGKILIKRVAENSIASQLNKNLILGKAIHVVSKPCLEIFTDNAKCTHGATVGTINEDELFYLQSRGINKEIAKNLLISGFFNDIFSEFEIICAKESVSTLSHFINDLLSLNDCFNDN